MSTFAYRSLDQTKNQAQVLKGGSDRPSVFIDFADGLISSAITITTVSAIALNSSGSSVTTNVVGTTAVSGTVARVDLRTCGANGTGEATDGDRFQMPVTATLSSGGPLIFDVFILVDNPTYAPV